MSLSGEMHREHRYAARNFVKFHLHHNRAAMLRDELKDDGRPRQWAWNEDVETLIGVRELWATEVGKHFADAVRNAFRAAEADVRAERAEAVIFEDVARHRGEK
jgi:hypothetical protein